jgi:hypothetical protein
VSAKQKSQKGFVAVTLITLLAIALVIVVYSAILGTFTGGPVSVVTQGGQITYCQNTTGPWTSTLGNIGTGSSWYALFTTTGTGHKGPVNMTWVLQWSDGTNVSPGVNQTTQVALTGNAGQVIYASTDGGTSGQKDWGASTTTAGTYQIKVTITAA